MVPTANQTSVDSVSYQDNSLEQQPFEGTEMNSASTSAAGKVRNVNRTDLVGFLDAFEVMHLKRNSTTRSSMLTTFVTG